MNIPLFFSPQRKLNLLQTSLNFPMEITIAHHSIPLKIAQQKYQILSSFLHFMHTPFPLSYEG